MKKIILALFILSSTLAGAQTIARIDLDAIKPLLFENYIQKKDPALWELYVSQLGAEEAMQALHMKNALGKDGTVTFDSKYLANQQQSSKNRMKLESDARNYVTEFLIESGTSERYDLILFSGYRRNIAFTKSNPEDITQFLVQELIKLKEQPVEEAQ